jgi:hypothetical protein
VAVSKWVYELATGRFLYGGFYEPTFDPDTQGVAEFDDANPNPDTVRERYDATAETLRRPATDEELDVAQAATVDAQLDDALVTGDVIILAAAQHLTVLFPDLPEPTAEQITAFTAAVRATSKDALRAAVTAPSA